MSTLKVTNIQHASASTAAIALNSDGQATLNGLNFPTAGALSNRNLIINGAMQVAQRGTSSTTNGFGTVDRYTCLFAGGAQTQTQETLTTGDPYDEGFRNFLRITNTTASTAASSYRHIQQKIEAQNIAQSGWNYTSSTSYVTLSFWVRASVSQEYYGYLRTEDGTDQLYAFSLGTLSADTWTKVTKTIPGNTNLQFDNNNGSGMRVVVAAFRGTDFTDSGVSVDTWTAFASGSQAPDYTNTWANTTDATFDLTGVQLEVGQVATPFEHRSYGDELAKCLRYYYRNSPATANATFCSGFNNAATDGQFLVELPVPMRTAPTSIDTTGTVSDYQIAHKSTVTTCSSGPTIASARTTTTCRIEASVSSGLTQGQGNQLRAKTTAAYLGFNAEL